MTSKKAAQEEKHSKTIMRGRLKGAQRYKLRKLVDMKYKPSELADELDIEVDWIYKIYVPLGCPHEKESRRHIWIIGTEFREWYLKTYRKHQIAENEAYCVSCKKPVPLVDPVENNKNGMTYLLSKCPHCGKTVAKIIHQKWRSQP